MKKSIKEKVIKMRLQGLSYSQIKERVNISKSTLSIWLSKYPLSPEKIRELRDWNPKRIENCRNTKLKNRQLKLDTVYRDTSVLIGSLSKRELFLAGMFLYWGEGTKAARDIVAFTNTDPQMIKFFVKWMESMGISRLKVRIKLHLYKDMDIDEKTKFWSSALKIPLVNFKKPYIKDSKFASLTYKNTFGHGTCSVIYGNSDLYNKIIRGLEYIRKVVSV